MLAIALLAFIFTLNWVSTFVGMLFPLDFLHFFGFAGKWCAIVAIAIAVSWCFGD
ncbi:MAG: hypothetical protein AAGA60_12610 [Cyanobacteria bacterium P01_E01_bin.42]